MKKFQITMENNNGSYLQEETEGTIVKTNYEIEFFIHRTKGGGYRISELSTGMAITSHHALRRDAINELHQIVEQKGIEVIAKKIQERQKDLQAKLVKMS